MIRPMTAAIWVRLLREHWPDHRGALFTLIMLASYLNRSAMAWPKIKTLIEDTGQKDRTIERHLDLAIKHGWLRKRTRYVKGRGRASKLTEYMAVVPESIDLTPLEQQISDGVVTRLRERAHQVSRAREQIAPEDPTPEAEGPDTKHPEDPTREAQGPDTGRGDTSPQQGPDTLSNKVFDAYRVFSHLRRE